MRQNLNVAPDNDFRSAIYPLTSSSPWFSEIGPCYSVDSLSTWSDLLVTMQLIRNSGSSFFFLKNTTFGFNFRDVQRSSFQCLQSIEAFL